MTSSWPRYELYFPSGKDFASGVMQNQGGESSSDSCHSELAKPAMVSRTQSDADSHTMTNPTQKGLVVSSERHDMAPQPGTVEPSWLDASGSLEGLSETNLPSWILATLAESHAPATRNKMGSVLHFLPLSPFEPFESIAVKELSLKTALLLAFASVNALGICDLCEQGLYVFPFLRL